VLFMLRYFVTVIYWLDPSRLLNAFSLYRDLLPGC
jgi:hypothetical protein